MIGQERALGWAAEQLGSEVVEAVPMLGGWTSTMLRLTDVRGGQSVLRLMTKLPWRNQGAALTTREHETQLALEGTPIPAPRSLALDAEGEGAGHPAHLMTLLPGIADLGRESDDDLDAICRLLVTIHAVTPETRPRAYESWAVPAKQVVPAWARDTAAWQRAFALLQQDPPTYDGTFLHRDFAPRNLLWTGGAITGVVDWVETSWGPPWLDVAHVRTMLAVSHGIESADRFGAAYERMTGREPQPYFDVMDIVGLLPHPERQPFLTDPSQQFRLEDQLVAVLDSLG